MTEVVKSKRLETVARAVSKMSYAETVELARELETSGEKIVAWATKNAPAPAPKKPKTTPATAVKK